MVRTIATALLSCFLLTGCSTVPPTKSTPQVAKTPLDVATNQYIDDLGKIAEQLDKLNAGYEDVSKEGKQFLLPSVPKLLRMQHAKHVFDQMSAIDSSAKKLQLDNQKLKPTPRVQAFADAYRAYLDAYIEETTTYTEYAKILGAPEPTRDPHFIEVAKTVSQKTAERDKRKAAYKAELEKIKASDPAVQ